MAKHVSHATHPAAIKRLKHANGHLASVIKMIEDEKHCVDIAQPILAVEKTIQQARSTLIQDHIDYCLNDAPVGHGEFPITAKFRAITKCL